MSGPDPYNPDIPLADEPLHSPPTFAELCRREAERGNERDFYEPELAKLRAEIAMLRRTRTDLQVALGDLLRWESQPNVVAFARIVLDKLLKDDPTL
jgi:hypothetical protein